MTTEIKVITPPTKLRKPCIFLAGSIEMGCATNWQSELIELLSKADFECEVFNPRRDDWDSSWEQRADNSKFREQVEWELDAMNLADLIVMHFEPGTKSPITLLEFGMYCRSEKLIVHCPDGFWKKGNIDVVCQRYGIWQAPTLNALATRVRCYGIDGTSMQKNCGCYFADYLIGS